MKNAVWVGILALWGCGAAAAPPLEATPAAEPEKREANVYDAAGQTQTCAKPAEECANPKTDLDLQSRCTMAGFRMAQCGCEMFCMGKPAPAEKTVFDAEGNPKACAKPVDDCSLPPASAAFQDACTNRGYRLETCGCEWLCSGNPTK